MKLQRKVSREDSTFAKAILNCHAGLLSTPLMLNLIFPLSPPGALIAFSCSHQPLTSMQCHSDTPSSSANRLPAVF